MLTSGLHTSIYTHVLSPMYIQPAYEYSYTTDEGERRKIMNELNQPTQVL